MKIEIKNVKYAAFASQDSNSFNAKIYVDGKAFAECNDDGHGGCIDIYPLNNVKREDIPAWRERLNAINAEIKAGPRVESQYFDDGLENDIELTIGMLMDDYLQAKEIKKILKRLTYVKPDCAKGEFYKAPAQIKPNADGIKRLKSQSWWKPEFVILNELSIDEAAKYL